MTIRILPPHISARIAAGEVVERPASVVKELLENAIDAGATSIEITARGSNLGWIIVSDNGVGMSHEDIGLSLHRHATSKFAGDLSKVSTLGYRGEALPSIACVASVRITSRPIDQEVAFTVASLGGQLHPAKPSAGKFGTRIEVTDLFSSVPARLKFLKSQRTEAACIREVISNAAMAHPTIDFRSDINGNETRFMARDNLIARAADVLGKLIADDGVPVDSSEGVVSVKGFACIPSSSRSDAAGLKFSVNGRPVSDKLLRSAVMSAYSSIIGPGRHPQAYLAVTVPTDMVDVNVHPQKAEVRFSRPAEVAAAVTNAVRNAISNSGLQSPANLAGLARKLSAAADVDISDRRRLPLGRFIGQANGSWLISETMEGIVIIDQHAAHERVIMERLKLMSASIADDTFSYPQPVTVPTTNLEAAAVDDAAETVLSMGFSVTASVSSVTLHSVPAVLSDCAPSDLVALVVRCAAEGAETGLLQEALWEKLATAACKAAIKAGDKLSPERADVLMREIEATPNASHCNHGRPTIAYLKDGEIAKLFARG